MSLEVVLAARQVELAARDGRRAETRGRLFERLRAAFVSEVHFADALACRIALAQVYSDPQLVLAIDEALAVLRPRGIRARDLGALEPRDPFAGVLRKAMNELDGRLAAAGLVDERLVGERVAEALARAHPVDVARVVGETRVHARHVVRWDHDAVWWRALASALRRAGGDASVELPVVSLGVDASRYADPFEEVIEATARLLDDAPSEAPMSSVFGPLTFAGDVPRDASLRVSLVRATDDEAQARAALLAVSAALGSGGTTDRVAIVVPPGFSAQAAGALARCFERGGVALAVARDEEAGALTHAVWLALGAGDHGLDRHDVAALLRSPVLDARAVMGNSEPRAARAALLDLADVLERTPTHASEELRDRCVETARAARGSAEHVQQRVNVAARVADLLLAPARADGRVGRVRASRACLAGLGIGARPSRSVRDALARDDVTSSLTRAELEAYAHDGRALESLAAALDDLERAATAVGDQGTCSFEAFRDELGLAWSARRGGASSRAGAVRVTRSDELAGEALDLLVVLDANAGVLPRVSQRPADRLAPAPPYELVELACAAQRASRVVVCWRTTDDDGSLLAPSPLVSWLARGGVATTTVHSAPLTGPPATPEERTLALVALAPEHALELAPHAARVAARERAREALHAGAEVLERLDVARLGTLLDVETGAGARPMSVTAVERALRCKFQGFAAQVLGALDDDPRTEDSPDRREEGVLVHEALAAAFQACQALFSVRPRDHSAIVDAASRAADAVLARGGGAVVRATLEQIRLEVAALVGLATEDDSWDFALAEQAFGSGGDDSWPPMVIERGPLRVALRGRIDRVDVARDASLVRAIDYKRRVTLPPHIDVGATSVQILLYALVAQRALGKTGARGRYLSTIKPAPETTRLFEERFEEALGTVCDHVLDAVAALRAGDVTPRPAAPKWCESCGLDGACRRPRFALTLEDP